MSNIESVIRSLLAKTIENGCTSEEAAAAAAKAAELMMKYNVEVGTDEPEPMIMRDAMANMRHPWVRSLCVAVGNMYSVFPLMTHDWKSIRFYGEKSAVELAKYTLLQMVARVKEDALNTFKRNYGSTTGQQAIYNRWVMSYGIGFSKAVNAAVQQSQKYVGANDPNALIVLNQKVAKAQEMVSAPMRDVGYRSTAIYRGAYDAGYEAGSGYNSRKALPSA